MADSSQRAAKSAESFWLDAWYEGRWWLWLLWPVSLMLKAVASLRRRHLTRKASPLSAPVIVVGNITLGGTGKTPVIISLVRYLQSKGCRPGVVSRGYGGQASEYPYLVTKDSPVQESGDEPLLIALETGCPVMVGADRVASAQKLIDEHGCDILLSDDGMQHYRLSRQWELCLLDGQRLWGNGLCLPAGPLRESPERLQQVNAVLINGDIAPQRQDENTQKLLASSFSMQLQPVSWHRLKDGEQRLIEDQSSGQGAAVPGSAGSIAAVTGIGNPQRFFNTLAGLGIQGDTRAFPDHHPFQPSDLAFSAGKTLIMTAKDAVKCRAFAEDDWWYLSVSAVLPRRFWAELDLFLETQS